MSAAGAHLADTEEPLDVAPREQRPVKLLELADGVGDGEEPPGLRGCGAGPQRQPESGPPGGGVDGFARGASPRRAPRLWPATVPDRLEASVSRPPAGATEAASTATSPAARLGCPRGAASSSTSTARSPDRPGSPRPPRPVPEVWRARATPPFTTTATSRGVRLRFVCATDQAEAPAGQPWSPPPRPRGSPCRSRPAARPCGRLGRYGEPDASGPRRCLSPGPAGGRCGRPRVEDDQLCDRGHHSRE